MIRDVVILTTIALWMTICARREAAHGYAGWAIFCVALAAVAQAIAARIFWKYWRSKRNGAP